MANLAEMLTETVAEYGDRIALKLDDLELPYSVVEEASARVAGLLAARGVEPGDRVGVMLPNLPYFPFVFYGALRTQPLSVACALIGTCLALLRSDILPFRDAWPSTQGTRTPVSELAPSPPDA